MKARLAPAAVRGYEPSGRNEPPCEDEQSLRDVRGTVVCCLHLGDSLVESVLHDREPVQAATHVEQWRGHDQQWRHDHRSNRVERRRRVVAKRVDGTDQRSV